MSRADVLGARDRGPAAPSLNEFADQFESALNEKRNLTFLLSKARVEIENLRAQLDARSDSLLAMKEKLMREEFDRKFQDLTLEVRRERNKYGEMVKELRKQLSSCICRARAR